ncbi:MAG: C39 family peptidase [Candidatus Brocadiae bacterium]|nr:C39 family peptidase [Candidatus Brocadiia bacterium]
MIYFNHYLLFSIPLALSLYFFGYKLAKRITSQKHKKIAFVVMLICVFPGLIIPIISITIILKLQISADLTLLLSLEGVELLPCFLAFPVAYLVTLKPMAEKIRWNIFSKYIIFICFMNIISCYLDNFLFPVEGRAKIKDLWHNNVCLQSTEYTCSPASLANILNYYGIKETEKTLAKGCYTSCRGTYTHYLIRCARKYGMECKVYATIKPEEIPIPSIITVKYLDSVLHSVAALAKENDRLLIADPMSGKTFYTYQELQKRHFTGHVIHVLKK